VTKSIHPAKRCFDILFSVCAGVILLPFMVLAVFSLFMEHILRGRLFDPILYKEIRMSAGQPFWLYKFNIFDEALIEKMRAEGKFIHTKDLERNGDILFVGWCLKQIYMDELPQLWCVLRGDMSIVGPRPVKYGSF